MNYSKEAGIIKEAIDQKTPGFRGFFVSSIAATGALMSNGFHVGGRVLSNVMQELGYIHHPNLRSGQCRTSSVWPDLGRPRLYVLEGSYVSQLTSHIEEAYSNAQRGIADKEDLTLIGDIRELLSRLRVKTCSLPPQYDYGMLVDTLRVFDECLKDGEAAVLADAEVTN